LINSQTQIVFAGLVPAIQKCRLFPSEKSSLDHRNKSGDDDSEVWMRLQFNGDA